MIIILMSHLLPSEDQSSGGPGEVRRELSPERIQLEGQRADTAPGSKREQWLDQAHPHHCRNNDVSALCERNKIDVLSVVSYLLTFSRFTSSDIFTLDIVWFDFYEKSFIIVFFPCFSSLFFLQYWYCCCYICCCCSWHWSQFRQYFKLEHFQCLLPFCWFRKDEEFAFLPAVWKKRGNSHFSHCKVN